LRLNYFLGYYCVHDRKLFVVPQVLHFTPSAESPQKMKYTWGTGGQRMFRNWWSLDCEAD